VTQPQRPLAGCIVNLSISEGDDSARRGFPLWQVNRVTLQIVAALLGQGASVVFGHDWREDGVMEAVYGFARQIQAPVPLSSANAVAESQPLLRNLLPWPDEPLLSERELEQLSSTLQVDRAGLPRELQAVDDEARRADPDNNLFRYVHARGLTFLRHRLNDACHVRLCLGGRRSGSPGRYPGVIEEAFLAVTEKKPLYLASFLGGATEQVVNAIDGKPMSEDFCGATPLQDLYARPPVKESDPNTRDDRIIDRTAIWKKFAEIGQEKFATVNGLTVKENNELLHTPVIDRAIELVLNGLSSLWHNGAGSEHLRNNPRIN
jgi:SLOG cluster2